MVEQHISNMKDVGSRLTWIIFYLRQKTRKRRKIPLFAKTCRLALKKTSVGNAKSPEISGSYNAIIFHSPDQWRRCHLVREVESFGRCCYSVGLGLGKLFPARESLVSDILAGDRNTAKPFLQCLPTLNDPRIVYRSAIYQQYREH